MAAARNFSCACTKPSAGPCTKLQFFCCCHFFLMVVMVSFGGFLLNDVFNCDGCLWFAVGTDHEASASASSSGWNSSNEEAIEGSVKAYTGTVRQALGFNSHQTPFSDFTEGCGMWVFHPHKWDNQPGKQIEFDVAVGSTPVVLEQEGVAYTAGGIVPVAPLSDASIESSCKVSLGGDGQLRNYKQDNQIISVGNCNKVSYVSDTSSGSNALAYKGRKVFGIIGLSVFLLIRGIQYFVLFSGLATKGDVELSEEQKARQEENLAGGGPTGFQEHCMAFCGVACCCGFGEKDPFKICGRTVDPFNWSLLAYDFVFFSEFPGLLLLPLNALEFHEDCDQILTFRFSATLWMLGAGFAAFGAICHLVDALIPVFRDPNASFFGAEFWPRVMIGVGALLTLFVAALKIIYVMRMGFTFALGLKLEWAFRFQFWPLTQAVCLDMFQLSAFFFFSVDTFFNAYAGYLKYFASEETKKAQAGRFALFFSKKKITCGLQTCSACGGPWEYEADKKRYVEAEEAEEGKFPEGWRVEKKKGERVCKCEDGKATTCGGSVEYQGDGTCFGEGQMICRKCNKEV